MSLMGGPKKGDPKVMAFGSVTEKGTPKKGGAKARSASARDGRKASARPPGNPPTIAENGAEERRSGGLALSEVSA